jgi:hypothetical protein
MKPVKVVQQAVEQKLKNGHTVVGVNTVQLVLGVKVFSDVTIRAPGTDDATPNTNTVWVGGSNVTADSDVETGGFPLLPGAAITLPVHDLSEVYLISDAAAQEVGWIGA